jgi:RNA recognition motif-containing protein
LATKADLDAMMSDSVRVFGVHIKGQRTTYVGSEERRELYVRGLAFDVDDSEVMEMLVAYTLDPAQVAAVKVLTDASGRPFGAASIKFKSHHDAYKASRYLMHPEGASRYRGGIEKTQRPLLVSWARKGPFFELLTRKEELERDNQILRAQIEQLQETTESLDRVVVPEDIKLSSVIFKHINKVLETTNFDARQAATLLAIPEARLKRMLADLGREGMPVEKIRQEFMKRRIRVKNSDL